jgi:hypothetical protein
MFWQIQTKSPVPPIKTPNPSITVWSNAANVVAIIKFDYLHTILSWLDGVVPKTGSGWKAVIGFNTVCVPTLSPKLSGDLLDPRQIFSERKELEGKCDEGDGHFDQTLPTTNTSTSSDKVVDGDTSAGVPDDSLKQVGDETIGPDDNDDDKCNKSHNDEGVKFGNDDPGLRVSPKNIGEGMSSTKDDKIDDTHDEGDGHFDVTVTKAYKSTISDQVSDADPSTVVSDKEGGDERKGHDDIIDDNDNKSDKDEGVISTNADPCMRVSTQRLEASSSLIKDKGNIKEKVNSLVILGEFAELHNPIMFITSFPSYIFYVFYDNP